MRKEADVKNEVKKTLATAGGYTHIWWFMPSANGYGRPGIPDFVGCVHGHAFAIETNFGGNKPTPYQAREAGNIAKAGGQFYLVDETNIEAFDKDFLDWVALITALEK